MKVILVIVGINNYLVRKSNLTDSVVLEVDHHHIYFLSGASKYEYPGFVF